MKKSRFTEEQIAFALRQAETGAPAREVCRKMGISEQTFTQLAYEVSERRTCSKRTYGLSGQHSRLLTRPPRRQHRQEIRHRHL